ncbi:MAG: carboxylesterase [Acidimicrobiaceae bacterium]|jgi:carboxylesterase
MPEPIIRGAEPESIDGGPNGALVIHGFTSNPHSMKGVAHALADAGFAVELPLLPGHGTAVEDMIPTGWSDWLGAAEEAYGKLAARVPGNVIVVGLSMGGALTCWLASEHPELAGIVAINAVVTQPEGMAEIVQQLLDNGDEVMDGIGSDIADPEVHELAYPETPLRPLLTMMEAAGEFQERLRRIACPVLIVTSRQDHVVAPENSDVLAESVTGPVERLWLERSYHVATQDYDKAEVEAAVVDFAKRVTS